MMARFVFDVEAQVKELGRKPRPSKAEKPADIPPKRPMRPKESQLSQESQGPHSFGLMPKVELNLSKTQQDAFEERAAIIEYDGAESRIAAEQIAFMDVTRTGL